ncbi:Alpha-galactosidase [Madurella fahalii]|uniref:Alpha-galactosidase n=1 Tax=Madurella fahalii TaxID=1157608 RepID=A0ABQ0GAD4_9PEZI
MLSSWLSLLAAAAGLADARLARSPTPPMGWNSYNTYSCSPTEQIIKSNAQGLVNLGLAALGYTQVTTDCGWLSRTRDAQGRLQWDRARFPSGGGKELGDFLHGLGLKFGLYSGAGYFQCGSTDLPASLGYEEVDARTFAEWGGDSLKYDNCYSTSRNQMVDGDSAEAKSPARFQKMAAVLDTVNRDIAYYVCQWGIGENVQTWASAIGNTWRISNDIYNAWRSIWRITNQVISHAKHTRVGAFADMDMLIVGLRALSLEEERFHFGMWAINKSPLLIGCPVNTQQTPRESIDILSNREVIAINQDPLAKPATLVLRYTQEEWDIWAGDLSGGRKVLGIANWRNQSQTVQFDLRVIGVASATARDVWAAADIGTISGRQTVNLTGHQLKLFVLSDIQTTALPASVGYYSAANASLSGSANLVSCGDAECAPTQRKIGNLGAGASATFNSIRATTAGRKLIGIDYIHYEYAFGTAWGWGTNTRNMTISVNGGAAKRWAFPLSGGDWFETGRMMIEVDGFQAGSSNQLIFRSQQNGGWAPDLVGFEVFE